MMRVLSLGAGVQSSTMALMAAHGELGLMPDCAIFADTQGEPPDVYEYLDWLSSPNVLPFPVYRVTRGNLWKSATRVRTTKDGERKYIETALPVFFRKEGLTKGMGQRHCTRDFKIEPVRRKCRELLGLKQVRANSGVLVQMLIGISTDEALRAKPSNVHWIEHEHPLLDIGMSRKDCIDWIARHDYPKPPRSACTFCTFHDDDEWMRLPAKELQKVFDTEQELRDAYAQVEQIKGIPYLHETCVPLRDVEFFNRPKRASKFGNECEGMCGV